MKARILTVSLLLLALCAPSRAQQTDTRTFRQALNLYDNGMYGRARTLFQEAGDTQECRGYAVLCALKMQSADCDKAFAQFAVSDANSALLPQMRFQYALNLFDRGEYAAADAQFSQVAESDIPSQTRTEATFKKGYCAYVQGYYGSAREHFREIDRQPVCDYTATARYLLGYMDYQDRSFTSAAGWFRQSREDSRFADLSSFYLIDCEFNNHNYDYVIENGPAMFDSVPSERRQRLARIISESYLVKGDKASAREYFDSIQTEGLTRSDMFYSGSVLYAVEDWRGAVESFSKMPDRTDSLGQIANYQMADAYLHLRNNVAAMDAFKAASEPDFDARIKEDASFNYAKLSFDLNKDTSGFADYIKTYSTRTKGEEIYNYMALAALYDRDYAAALDAYDHIDELDDDMRSNYTKANYLRANQLVESGSWRDAVPYLKASAYYYPKTDRFNQISRYWLAEAQYRSGSYSDAAGTFLDLYNGSALDGTTESVYLPYNVAYCHFKDEDWSQAAKWFDNAASVQGSPYREDALVRRADCDFARKDYKAAVKSYQKVLDEYYSADNIYPYWRQAQAYGLSGDKKKKAQVLSAVEGASPSAPLYDEAMYELGRTHIDNRNSGDAVRVLRRLRRETSDSTVAARALIGLGMVNRNANNHEMALECYKRVVEMLPGSSYADDALLAIESIYQSKGEAHKYLEYVEQNKLNARKSASEREAMYFNTAEQVYLAGNYPQAVNSIQQYLDEFPEGENRAQALFYLAESWKQTGDKEKAADCYEASVKAGATGSIGENARLGYANLSYGLERWQAAYSGYSDLYDTAKIEANRTTARTGMMRSAYRAKDWDNAISAASDVALNKASSKALRREAEYVKAKSCLARSRRDEAMELFRSLSSEPSTAEGAEATYIVIQDLFDRGEFQSVENAVYDFSSAAGDQSYWLAKAFITLADSFRERGMTDQAKATLESVRDGYQPSDSRDDIPGIVEQRLQRLQKQQ